MIVTQKIHIDLLRPGIEPQIHAAQDDKYSRNIKIRIFAAGVPWVIPEDASVLVRYRKPDGTGGLYDTLPDGNKASSMEGNELTIVLAPQMLTVAGPVSLTVTMIEGKQQLTTFLLWLQVHPDASADAEDSAEYINVTSFLPAPKSAKPGQYFRVVAVDENGKVTEVESVDVAVGGDVDLSGYVKSVNGVKPDKDGNVAITIPDSSQNGNGLTTAEKALILTLFRNAAYTADMSETFAQLETLWGGNGESGGGDVHATGITLSVSALTFTDYDNQTITATLEPAGSTDKVVWFTSNNSVATVENGVVTPIGNGSCIITAMAGGVSATCAVTVNIAAEVKRYTITRNLTNCTSSSGVSVINENATHSETITPDDGYTLDGATMTITMGGVDISSCFVDGVLTIDSVTGNIVIYISCAEVFEIVNLFDATNATTNAFIDAGGNKQDFTLFSHTDYIQIKSDTSYVLQMDTTYTYARGEEGICFYDANKNFISRTILNKVENGVIYRAITSPSNAKYAIVNYFTTSTNVMLFEGTAAIL